MYIYHEHENLHERFLGLLESNVMIDEARARIGDSRNDVYSRVIVPTSTLHRE